MNIKGALMKRVFILLTLLFTLQIFATVEEVHQSKNEKACSKEIQRLNCGSREDYKGFIACIDFKVDELSERCQDYLMIEIERLKNQGL